MTPLRIGDSVTIASVDTCGSVDITDLKTIKTNTGIGGVIIDTEPVSNKDYYLIALSNGKDVKLPAEAFLENVSREGLPCTPIIATAASSAAESKAIDAKPCFEKEICSRQNSTAIPPPIDTSPPRTPFERVLSGFTTNRDSEAFLVRTFAVETIQSSFRRYMACRDEVKKRKIASVERLVLNMAAETITSGVRRASSRSKIRKRMSASGKSLPSLSGDTSSTICTAENSPRLELAQKALPYTLASTPAPALAAAADAALDGGAAAAPVKTATGGERVPRPQQALTVDTGIAARAHKRRVNMEQHLVVVSKISVGNLPKVSWNSENDAYVVFSCVETASEKTRALWSYRAKTKYSAGRHASWDAADIALPAAYLEESGLLPATDFGPDYISSTTTAAAAAANTAERFSDHSEKVLLSQKVLRIEVYHESIAIADKLIGVAEIPWRDVLASAGPCPGSAEQGDTSNRNKISSRIVKTGKKMDASLYLGEGSRRKARGDVSIVVSAGFGEPSLENSKHRSGTVKEEEKDGDFGSVGESSAGKFSAIDRGDSASVTSRCIDPYAAVQAYKSEKKIAVQRLAEEEEHAARRSSSSISGGGGDSGEQDKGITANVDRKRPLFDGFDDRQLLDAAHLLKSLERDAAAAGGGSCGDSTSISHTETVPSTARSAHDASGADHPLGSADEKATERLNILARRQGSKRRDSSTNNNSTDNRKSPDPAYRSGSIHLSSSKSNHSTQNAVPSSSQGTRSRGTAPSGGGGRSSTGPMAERKLRQVTTVFDKAFRLSMQQQCAEVTMTLAELATVLDALEVPVREEYLSSQPQPQQQPQQQQHQDERSIPPKGSNFRARGRDPSKNVQLNLLHPASLASSVQRAVEQFDIVRVAQEGQVQWRRDREYLKDPYPYNMPQTDAEFVVAQLTKLIEGDHNRIKRSFLQSCAPPAAAAPYSSSPSAPTVAPAAADRLLAPDPAGIDTSTPRSQRVGLVRDGSRGERRTNAWGSTALTGFPAQIDRGFTQNTVALAEKDVKRESLRGGVGSRRPALWDAEGVARVLAAMGLRSAAPTPSASAAAAGAASNSIAAAPAVGWSDESIASFDSSTLASISQHQHHYLHRHNEYEDQQRFEGVAGAEFLSIRDRAQLHGEYEIRPSLLCARFLVYRRTAELLDEWWDQGLRPSDKCLEEEEPPVPAAAADHAANRGLSEQGQKQDRGRHRHGSLTDVHGAQGGNKSAKNNNKKEALSDSQRLQYGAAGTAATEWGVLSFDSDCCMNSKNSDRNNRIMEKRAEMAASMLTPAASGKRSASGGDQEQDRYAADSVRSGKSWHSRGQNDQQQQQQQQQLVEIADFQRLLKYLVPFNRAYGWGCPMDSLTVFASIVGGMFGYATSSDDASLTQQNQRVGSEEVVGASGGRGGKEGGREGGRFMGVGSNVSVVSGSGDSISDSVSQHSASVKSCRWVSLILEPKDSQNVYKVSKSPGVCPFLLKHSPDMKDVLCFIPLQCIRATTNTSCNPVTELIGHSCGGGSVIPIEELEVGTVVQVVDIALLRRLCERFDWWDRPPEEVLLQMAGQCGEIVAVTELENKRRVGVSVTPSAALSSSSTSTSKSRSGSVVEKGTKGKSKSKSTHATGDSSENWRENGAVGGKQQRQLVVSLGEVCDALPIEALRRPPPAAASNFSPSGSRGETDEHTAAAGLRPSAFDNAVVPLSLAGSFDVTNAARSKNHNKNHNSRVDLARTAPAAAGGGGMTMPDTPTTRERGTRHKRKKSSGGLNKSSVGYAKARKSIAAAAVDPAMITRIDRSGDATEVSARPAGAAGSGNSRPTSNGRPRSAGSGRRETRLRNMMKKLKRAYDDGGDGDDANNHSAMVERATLNSPDTGRDPNTTLTLGSGNSGGEGTTAGDEAGKRNSEGGKFSPKNTLLRRQKEPIDASKAARKGIPGMTGATRRDPGTAETDSQTVDSATSSSVNDSARAHGPSASRSGRAHPLSAFLSKSPYGGKNNLAEEDDERRSEDGMDASSPLSKFSAPRDVKVVPPSVSASHSSQQARASALLASYSSDFGALSGEECPKEDKNGDVGELKGSDFERDMLLFSSALLGAGDQSAPPTAGERGDSCAEVQRKSLGGNADDIDARNASSGFADSKVNNDSSLNRRSGGRGKESTRGILDPSSSRRSTATARASDGRRMRVSGAGAAVGEGKDYSWIKPHTRDEANPLRYLVDDDDGGAGNGGDGIGNSSKDSDRRNPRKDDSHAFKPRGEAKFGIGVTVGMKSAAPAPSSPAAQFTVKQAEFDAKGAHFHDPVNDAARKKLFPAAAEATTVRAGMESPDRTIHHASAIPPSAAATAPREGSSRSANHNSPGRSSGDDGVDGGVSSSRRPRSAIRLQRSAISVAAVLAREEKLPASVDESAEFGIAGVTYLSSSSAKMPITALANCGAGVGDENSNANNKGNNNNNINKNVRGNANPAGKEKEALEAARAKWAAALAGSDSAESLSHMHRIDGTGTGTGSGSGARREVGSDLHSPPHSPPVKGTQSRSKNQIDGGNRMNNGKIRPISAGSATAIAAQSGAKGQQQPQQQVLPTTTAVVTVGDLLQPADLALEEERQRDRQRKREREKRAEKERKEREERRLLQRLHEEQLKEQVELQQAAMAQEKINAGERLARKQARSTLRQQQQEQQQRGQGGEGREETKKEKNKKKIGFDLDFELTATAPTVSKEKREATVVGLGGRELSEEEQELLRREKRRDRKVADRQDGVLLRELKRLGVSTANI